MRFLLSRHLPRRAAEGVVAQPLGGYTARPPAWSMVRRQAHHAPPPAGGPPLAAWSLLACGRAAAHRPTPPAPIARARPSTFELRRPLGARGACTHWSREPGEAGRRHSEPRRLRVRQAWGRPRPADRFFSGGCSHCGSLQQPFVNHEQQTVAHTPGPARRWPVATLGAARARRFWCPSWNRSNMEPSEGVDAPEMPCETGCNGR